MPYRLKIAKSAYNKDSPDQKMIVHSDFPILKLKESGQGTLTKAINSNQEIVEITHNLGYKPIAFVHGKYLDESAYPTATVLDRYRYFSFSDTPGLELWEWYRFYTNTTKLFIDFTTTAYFTSEVALDYFYHIFYDEEE